jgi:predicted transcriptional regulator
MPSTPERRALDVTVAIVASYAAHNQLPAGALPTLIATVHAALETLRDGRAPAPPQVRKPTPSEIRRSVTPDALVSFIDGRPYKTLRRHLAGHGLSPAAYRERYGLPGDYPLVAQAYSERRSRIAKAIELGVPRRD